MAKSISGWIKKELNRHFTVMLIPHSGFKPLRISFTVSFLIFLFVVWTGLTVWAGYLSSKHIDYWRVRTEHHLLKLKMSLLAKQLNQSREYLDQVKENDNQIRELLELKSKKAIITNDAKGGPTAQEMKNLDLYIAGKLEITPEDLYKQALRLKEISRARLESISEVMTSINQQRSLYRSTPNIWPTSGRITSPYGFRIHPIYNTFELHTGIDIAAERDTPVMATAEGKVLFTGWAEGYGKLIIIDHGNNYKTYYGHLNKIFCKVNDIVKRKAVIGTVGDTGSSTGYHLHYEVRFNDKTLNPKRYLEEDNFFAKGEIYVH